MGVAVLSGFTALEWAWQHASTNLYVYSKLSSFYSSLNLDVHTDRQTDGIIYMFIWSKTIHSTCYILLKDSSIPFHSTSKKYKNRIKSKRINTFWKVEGVIVFCVWWGIQIYNQIKNICACERVGFWAIWGAWQYLSGISILIDNTNWRNV